MSIPQRIIQTGRDRTLSPLAKASVTNLKLLHPEWEYRFFDDAGIAKFVAEEFPQYRQVFEAFPRAIQRIDFFRYLAIFRLGGFYFDLDVLLFEELSSLRNLGCVFPFEELTINRFLRGHHGIDWEIGNYAFGAAPGHPYLAAVIANCLRGQKDRNWVAPMMTHVPRLFRSDYEVLNTTGPGLLTRTFAENPEATANLTVLFPKDVCDPETWHLFGNYGVHLMQGSWRGRKGYLRRRFGNLWEAWMTCRMLRESRHQGRTREPFADASISASTFDPPNENPTVTSSEK